MKPKINYVPATPLQLFASSGINLNSLRHCSDNRFEHPTASEVKELRKLCNLTQIDVAKIVGVSYTKRGSSTVAKWETCEIKQDHRRIPYSAWRLLLLELEIVTLTVPLKE